MGATSETAPASAVPVPLHEGERCQDFFVRLAVPQRALITFRMMAFRSSAVVPAQRAA